MAEVLQHLEASSCSHKTATALKFLLRVLTIARDPWDMDPLSALAIAAAVVQFADFGFRLLKSAHELYKSPSGQRSDYIELSIVSQDLSRLADAVRAKLGEHAGLAGEVFLRLCGDCASTKDELQNMLDKLRAQGCTKIALAADSWRVTFRQVAAAGDVKKLAHRLDQIRQQMNVTLLYLLLSAHPQPFSDI